MVLAHYDSSAEAQRCYYKHFIFFEYILLLLFEQAYRFISFSHFHNLIFEGLHLYHAKNVKVVCSVSQSKQNLFLTLG